MRTFAGTCGLLLVMVVAYMLPNQEDLLPVNECEAFLAESLSDCLETEWAYDTL